jgi:hypothetical protein
MIISTLISFGSFAVPLSAVMYEPNEINVRMIKELALRGTRERDRRQQKPAL